MELSVTSKYCISKAISNDEPYYLVKVVNTATKEIAYDFINHSFEVLRVPYGACMPCLSTFRGDKRGLVASWRGCDWQVKDVMAIAPSQQLIED